MPPWLVIHLLLLQIFFQCLLEALRARQILGKDELEKRPLAIAVQGRKVSSYVIDLLILDIVMDVRPLLYVSSWLRHLCLFIVSNEKIAGCITA